MARRSFLLPLLISFLSFPVWAVGTSPTPARVSDAQAFVKSAETRLLDLWTKSQRAAWVKSNFITDDTEAIEAEANRQVLAATVELALAARRYEKINLPADLKRKLYLLRNGSSLVAPRDPAKQKELAEIASWLEGTYGKGRYCPPGKTGEDCLDLTKIEDEFGKVRDPARLTELWNGWHAVGTPMKAKYARFVQLANEGARELGFRDSGAMWRSNYDMTPAAFSTELDRLWDQVRPLYASLHCYVRGKLAEKYGKEIVRDGAPIPTHLLGNMWAQEWSNIYDLVRPAKGNVGYDLTKILKSRKLGAQEMVRYGEGFFTSLGFDPLPATFWDRSLFRKPRDREVVCHASAWDIDSKDDLRIKMCIEPADGDFRTVHHELGHNFYQRAYKNLSPLFEDGANDGFHEGIGDTIALSITPEYLVKVGLLKKVPPADADIGVLLKTALDKVAFLPFGLVIDNWRWKVFAGEVRPAEYNRAWWELKRKYQGVAPPKGRSDADFDPGAKFHIAANVPYMRYFLAHVMQFQFHRALCKAVGGTGPLHRCSIYGNKDAGKKLIKMLEMGRSHPWPEALQELTGERAMDATAILDYFQPLREWLDEQNRGQKCGW
ncbi:MAG: M2 family metallopeptidase [Pseudomonadota bacterium]